MFDPEENGLSVAQAADLEVFAGPGKRASQQLFRKNPPHMKAVLGATRILRETHIPFGVVTNATLDQLRNYRAVMIPSVLALTPEQAEIFRSFVREGGVLYVSGPSSLDQLAEIGSRLEDVLGVRYLGTIGSVTTYLTPSDAEIRKVAWPQENITFPGRMVQAKALPGAEVLATITLPYPGSEFVASPIESRSEAVYAPLVSLLIHRCLPRPYRFELDTHRSVEMTLFHQNEKHRMLVGLLNTQVEAPRIAVGATVRVHLPAGLQARRVLFLPEQKEMAFAKAGPYVQFTVPPFKVVAMALVEYA
jgi:hypothetical protein